MRSKFQLDWITGKGLKINPKFFRHTYIHTYIQTGEVNIKNLKIDSTRFNKLRIKNVFEVFRKM